jgi:hypothetical protein
MTAVVLSTSILATAPNYCFSSLAELGCVRVVCMPMEELCTSWCNTAEREVDVCSGAPPAESFSGDSPFPVLSAHLPSILPSKPSAYTAR